MIDREERKTKLSRSRTMASNSDGCTDVCREQERLILTKFLDVLRGLVTHGSIKG